MKRVSGWDVTSSDYEDDTITRNVAFNAALNSVSFPHIPHAWGTLFPSDQGLDIFHYLFDFDMELKYLHQHVPLLHLFSLEKSFLGPFDVVIANDFLIYVSEYEKLAHTLQQLLRWPQNQHHKTEESTLHKPHFIFCSKRHVRVVDSPTFFEVLDKNGFIVTEIGPRIWDVFYSSKTTNEISR
jgi:hypothetical protein